MRAGRIAAAAGLLACIVAALLAATVPETKKPPAKAAAKPATNVPAQPKPKAAPTPASGPEVKVVEVVLDGQISERMAMAMPFGPQPKLLRDFTGSIRKAADDGEIKAMVLRIRQPMMGLAKRQELMDAIGEFKAKGKKVFCYLDATTNFGYLMACTADRITAAPAGMILLTGLAAEVSFYKGLLDWAGIEAHFVASGKHKSAADSYTRESMSEANREVFNEYLDDVYGQFVKGIAEGRKLTPAKVREAIDNGPYSAPAAHTAKLVDEVAYYDQFLDGVGKALKGKAELVKGYHRMGKRGPDLAQMNLFSFFAALQPKPAIPAGKRPKIVIVYASGVIAPASAGLFGMQTVSAAGLHDAFDKARTDKTVKAVVLRVDSPGGSALISDLIWRDIRRIQQAGKPVIASMSDVAASGGYYIAMPCDAIVAQPGTVTGSIGVLGGKLAMGKLYEKIGIKVETFTRGKNAAIFSGTTRFSESEAARLKAMLDGIYTDFVQKAADGRKMPVEKMRELATGRIWTAQAAIKAGLVDKLGGLKEAYDLAVEKAGLKGNKDVQPVILPREKSFLEAILDPMSSRVVTLNGKPIPDALLRKMPALQVLGLLATENVLAIMPFHIETR